MSTIVVARIPAREQDGITDGAAAAVSTLHPGACIMLSILLILSTLGFTSDATNDNRYTVGGAA